MPEEKMRGITRRLLNWYAREKRPLPWRETPDPYRIWVSEIMLQQTQVDTAVPFYGRFLRTFPSLRSLADAPLGDVLKAWENLGYYTRARNLQQAARKVQEKFGGKLPATREELLSLPGIGPYTADAILSIAFGMPVPAVDGNVRRVISRIFALKGNGGPRSGETIRALAEALVPKRKAGDFNQALMDLGATLCTPRRPDCRSCPLQRFCLARSEGLQDSIPLKAGRKSVPHKDMTAAVIKRGGRFLVVQRPGRGLLAGLWKLPGGLKEEGETLEAGLARRVREEVGITIRVGKILATVNHAYSHFRVTLHAFQCLPAAGRARVIDCAGCRWIRKSEMDSLAFSKADREVLRAL